LYLGRETLSRFFVFTFINNRQGEEFKMAKTEAALREVGKQESILEKFI